MEERKDLLLTSFVARHSQESVGIQIDFGEARPARKDTFWDLNWLLWESSLAITTSALRPRQQPLALVSVGHATVRVL